MHRDGVSTSLDEAQTALAALLSWPENLGVEFRRLRLQSTTVLTEILVVFIHGVADEDRLRRWVLEPLTRMARREAVRLTPGAVAETLPGMEIQPAQTVSALVAGIMDGWSAILFDGADEALLVDTQECAGQLPRSSEPTPTALDVFGPELKGNVASLRKRLRDPGLIAKPVTLTGSRAATVAVVYFKGRASDQVLAQVLAWVREHAGEELLRRGGAAGNRSKFGLLPRFLTTPWPDLVTSLLDVGYVAVLVDRLGLAYLAPVTLAAMLYAPGDQALRRPTGRLLRAARAALAGLTLLTPGGVVAMLGYHPEMIPTSFIFALTARRESAAFPIIAEMAVLLVLHELMREARVRQPSLVSPGAALIAWGIAILVLLQAGFVGPMPAVAALIVALAFYSFPGSDLASLIRSWIWPMLIGAAVFGLFGLATVSFWLGVYASQSRSFGVPVLGETGIDFTAPGRTSSQAKGDAARG